MTDRMIPSVEQAERLLGVWMACRTHPDHDGCGICHYIHRQRENAALALDVARSVGRRWSAPSWLEEVAW